MAGKSKKKRGTSSKSKKKNTGQSFVGDEILIWASLAVSLLLLISNFGMGGFLGDGVAAFLSAAFGWVAYAVPFLLFGTVAFTVSNRGNANAYLKTGAVVVLTILACTLFQLVDDAGGFVGSILAGLLVPAIGTAGTYVVVIILAIICLVLITGKSLLKGVRDQSSKAYDRAREDAARRREEARARQLERENEAPRQRITGRKRRTDRRVEGVSFNTTLAEPEAKEVSVPEIKEEEKLSQFHISRGEDLPPWTEEEEETAGTEPVLPTGKKSREKSGSEVASETSGVAASIAADAAKPKKAYRFPPMSLLKKGSRSGGDSDAHLRETAMKLQQTLENFGVKVTVTDVSCGPSVTRYELQPEMGVKVSKIVGLADDIKLNLAAADIRIEAPIPGKAAVGIEVPNKENSVVMLRDLLETPEFQNSSSKIAFAAGKDIAGKTVVADIARMPHVLIAGATGSGKSVCINTLIMSILYKASPEEVRLIMIDPKVVELSVYNGIPHLMIPVVTDPKKAAGALNWAVMEMTRRYQAFAECNVRDIKGYNSKVAAEPQTPDGEKREPMPQIVIIVDELADLMMVAPGEVEESICRLAQLARAAGLHLVLATQRPSVNVITGLIKANMPSRIAFAVSSGVDSRTIIDMNGAEKLLGKGDMLFYPSGYQKPARVQGAFVTDKEVQNVVDYLKTHNGDADYDEAIEEQVATGVAPGGVLGGPGSGEEERDVYFADAGRLIVEKEKASIGMLQRSFKIGFNRAARIMDQLCEAGVVGGEEGTKPRKILMSMEEFEAYLSENS
nr:DNA translocase FtsK [Massilistercora timonensis]